MSEKRGKLAVMEGIDGSGKGIQVKLLIDRLNREGLEVVSDDSITRPVFGGAMSVGCWLRSLAIQWR